jgi:hypothetical protein
MLVSYPNSIWCHKPEDINLIPIPTINLSQITNTGMVLGGGAKMKHLPDLVQQKYWWGHAAIQKQPEELTDCHHGHLPSFLLLIYLV